MLPLLNNMSFNMITKFLPSTKKTFAGTNFNLICQVSLGCDVAFWWRICSSRRIKGWFLLQDILDSINLKKLMFLLFYHQLNPP